MSEKVLYFSNPLDFQKQEALYLEARAAEGRVLSDAQVQELPNWPAQGSLGREWRWRAHSLRRFTHYLAHKNRALRILDLGCGNGWMANHLAKNLNWAVTAIDLNVQELEQAARLFARGNLDFVYADIFGKNIESQHFESVFGKFDVILMAASAQYFSSLEGLVEKTFSLLNPGGELHILDTRFYADASSQAAAKLRSAAYYTQLGVPEMAQYYHHHHWGKAAALGAHDFNSTAFTRLLQRVGWVSPLDWLRFRAEPV
jgi:SAM-dependent methyltransferase